MKMLLDIRMLLSPCKKLFSGSGKKLRVTTRLIMVKAVFWGFFVVVAIVITGL